MILTAFMSPVVLILASGVFASWLMGAFEMTLRVCNRLPGGKLFQANLRVFDHRLLFTISPRSLAFFKWAVVFWGHNLDDRGALYCLVLLSFLYTS